MKEINNLSKITFTNKFFLCAFFLFAMIFLAIFVYPSFIYSQNIHRTLPRSHDLRISNEVFKELSFEQRLLSNRAIEYIYYQHRNFPGMDQKPSFELMVTEDILSENVKNYLRKGNALKKLWRHTIRGNELQSEINRMAAKSLRPDMLRELWAALGNDGYLVAECLARPLLVERLIEDYYAYDISIHQRIRMLAEAETKKFSDADQMKSMNGEYMEVEYIKRKNGIGTIGGSWEEKNSVILDEQEWNKLSSAEMKTAPRGYHRYSASVSKNHYMGNITLDDMRPGDISPLFEDKERYYVIALVEKNADRMKIASITWRKEPFEKWWKRVSSNFGMAVDNVAYIYELPESKDTSCSNDTWVRTAGPPDPRINHTALWTGTEMIIWGGKYLGHTINSGGKYDPATDTWREITVVNAPSARVRHTAVWTGTEMIIWGGATGVSYDKLSNGARYNPATDTWTMLSDDKTPSCRANHAAIWTGTEMIIWGGEHCLNLECNYENTGGIYNPETDTWRETSTGESVPEARTLHTAIWTGKEMIIWGGNMVGVKCLNNGAKYFPDDDKWISLSNEGVPEGRVSHKAVWSGEEMIIWGGMNCMGQYLNTGGKYSPTDDKWEETATSGAPAARSIHTAVWSGTEMIIWGGYGGFITFFNDGGRYNPGTNSWTAIPSADDIGPRCSHSAVWTGAEMIIWGGRDRQGRPINTGRRFNPKLNSWSSVSVVSVPDERISHTVVWTGVEMIIWGGYNKGKYLGSGGRYDPVTDSWKSLALEGAPEERANHSAIWTGTEMIIWGGGSKAVFNSGASYNPVKNSWTDISLNEDLKPRKFHTAVWVSKKSKKNKGYMIIWGGTNAFKSFNDGAKYFPESDSWTPISIEAADLLESRNRHTAVWTGKEMIIWGGWNEKDSYNTGARYNPETDKWIAMSTGDNVPVPRNQHTAVWTGKEMIIWGGWNGQNYFNSGGKYNPENDSWSATSAGDNVPVARNEHTAIWTGAEMIVWGGFSGKIGEDTGARYNPVSDSWSEISLAKAPFARKNAAAIWTGEQTHEMIIWGGIDEALLSELNTGGRYCVK